LLHSQDGALCNEAEEMTPKDFEAAMRQQLTLFLQVRTAAAAAAAAHPLPAGEKCSSSSSRSPSSIR
jgi:hypothetical protein